MNRNELRKKLNQPYNQQEWKDVVDFVFPHFSEFAGDQNLPIEPKDQAIVESFKQLGQVRLADGKNLALFELKLKENVNIIRNRVKLNDIVSSYIDQEQFHGVLSIFEQGKEDYRFTFAAKASEFDEDAGDFINKKTDTKRFTYVLGKNESCRTAAERFHQLSEAKDKADIDAIEKAFSVESLSKKFFKEYKDHYTMFVQYLTQTPSYYTAVFNNDDKAIRDFVKLLLGRLVFIKFVQKKGWLGVPATEQGWENGNFRFIEHSFETFAHQDNFYSQFLNPLFFEGFDKPDRPNDVYENTNYKIPFLSGGLFDNEDPKTKTINFPKAHFESLFEFLERYNFTIDENDTSMDREVGIDPEMLGHIFENLLEDNKDKGAFYTPKEIVRYMCQESLKEYLKTYLQAQNQWSKDEVKQQELEDAIHKFVTLKEAAGVIDMDAALANALKVVKICDPAIGSGAFPMGLLNEIFQLVHKLYEASPDKVGDIWKMQTWQPDTVKLNIIQQSIYGVDIEKGAVDIARLRFWLSLVVDSKEPHALPHLDYKIVVGDSLVSKLEDTIIDIDWDLQPKVVQADIFGNEGKTSDKRKLIEEITALQKQIFDPESDDDALSLNIRNKKIDLLILQLEIMIDEDGVSDKPQGNSRQIKVMTEKWLQTKGWKQQIEKLKKMKQGDKTPLAFFDWKLDFPEVMNEQISDAIGFDIVIGNPPYMIIFDEILKYELEQNYNTFKRNNDIYIAFLEFSIKLLKKNKGVLSFITPNTFLNGDYFKKFRFLLNELVKIIEIRDFKNSKVFQDPTVFVSISTLKSNNSVKKFPYSFRLKVPNEDKNEDVFKVLVDSLGDEPYKKRNEIFEKVIQNEKSVLLDDYFYVKDVGFNYWTKGRGKQRNKTSIGSRVFYSGDKKNSKDISFIKGRDIDFYSIGKASNYLIHNYKDRLEENDTFRFSPDFLSIKPKIVYRQTANKLIAAIDYDGLLNDKTVHIIVPKKMDKEISLITILGLINSKLFEYLYRYISQETEGRTFAQVKTTYVKKLPIISEVPDILNVLIQNIMKSQNVVSDYDIYKNKIDNLVYKLYNLTYPEVLIIEPTFSERMSEEEYATLEVE